MTTSDQPARRGDRAGASPQGPSADAASDDGREESLNERLDRNWIEILQELRVTQTGTQIFTGFLLGVAFQQRFADLTAFQQHTYLVLVSVAVLTTALGLTPVSMHRSLFRHHAKATVVRTGHLVLRAVLLGVGLMLTGTMLLLFDLVVGRAAALVAASGTLAVVVVIASLPTLLRLAKPTGRS